jgi:hypothetical protein
VCVGLEVREEGLREESIERAAGWFQYGVKCEIPAGVCKRSDGGD